MLVYGSSPISGVDRVGRRPRSASSGLAQLVPQGRRSRIEPLRRFARQLRPDLPDILPTASIHSAPT